MKTAANQTAKQIQNDPNLWNAVAEKVEKTDVLQMTTTINISM
jgi:hypothetical protein